MFSRNARRLIRCTFHTQKRALQNSAFPAVSHFNSVAGNESSKYQIYISTTNDPYLNLSIEHYLLQASPAESTILFLYANRPCVVIGRNQNPWLETNLRLLSLPRGSPSSSTSSNMYELFGTSPSYIELIRRRSGGGTVFHGPGNVNYSVICPSDTFTRDKHADMIAQALQSMNSTAHVNARHDIVLSPSTADHLRTPEPLPSEASPPDASAFAAAASAPLATRKVSGSAYKLTRGRALHHGTCLLCTPHLEAISTFLSSPTRGFLQARGVDSVRSPIANVLPPATDVESLARNVSRFHSAVLRAFADLYPAASLSKPDIQSILDAVARMDISECEDGQGEDQDTELLTLHANTIAGVLGRGLVNLPSVKEGMAELRSEEWLFGQTPRFTLSSLGVPAAVQGSPVMGIENSKQHFKREEPPTLPSGVHVYLSSRGGVVKGAALSGARDFNKEDLHKLLEEDAGQEHFRKGSLGAALKGRQLWRMGERDWEEVMRDVEIPWPAESGSKAREAEGKGEREKRTKRKVAAWFASMLALPWRGE